MHLHIVNRSAANVVSLLIAFLRAIRKRLVLVRVSMGHQPVQHSILQPVSKRVALKLTLASIGYAVVINITHEQLALRIGEGWDLVLDTGLLVVFVLFAIRFVIRPISAAADSNRVLATSVLEAAGDGIVVFDANGAIETINPAAERIFGWPKEEITSENVTRLFVASVERGRSESTEIYLSSVLLAASGGTFESLALQRNGNTLPVEVSVFEINVPGKRRFSAIIHDISERKRAEEALRQAEAKYRIVADNTFDWEFWVNPEGRFEYSSPSCKRITGHDREEFAANPGLLGSIIHPDDRARFDLHRQVARGGVYADEVKFRIIRPDGEVRWIAHVCQPVFDQEGVFIGTRGSNRDSTKRHDRNSDEFLGTRGSNRDITERKRLEMELRESESTKTAILLATPDIMLVIAADGTFVDVIAGKENLLYPKEHVLGRKVTDLLPPDVAENTIRGIARVTLTNEIESLVYSLNMPNGEHWYEARLSAIKDTGLVLAIIRDTTTEKQLERQMLEATARKKQLDSFHQVAITLQHEINNPLAGVLGLAELLNLQLPEIVENLSAETATTLQGSVSGIINLSHRIAGVVRKLREVQEPIISLYPVATDKDAEMIDLRASN